MINWISKILKLGKRKRDKRIFQTNEDLYFIRMIDARAAEEYAKYSYKDFNINTDFRSYIQDGTKIELYYKDEVISDATLVVESDTPKKLVLKFGWITSLNEYMGNRSFGGMTFLVASIIYIMLNDEELMQQDIEVSLEMHCVAKQLLQSKNIDVYYNIFRTPKINYAPDDTSRKYIFKVKDRSSDKDYFKKLLISKEQSILEAKAK